MIFRLREFGTICCAMRICTDNLLQNPTFHFNFAQSGYARMLLPKYGTNITRRMHCHGASPGAVQVYTVDGHYFATLRAAHPLASLTFNIGTAP